MELFSLGLLLEHNSTGAGLSPLTTKLVTISIPINADTRIKVLGWVRDIGTCTRVGWSRLV
jgi:hypothetical protein